MSKKPYDLSERDKPTRGIAADFRARWIRAEWRISELNKQVDRLSEELALANILLERLSKEMDTKQ